ncbi:YfiR family protein, partial [Fulvivirga sp. RKSG066]|uniref:YfiR family protein n=1 Tax=Fulvivirga aurantia TaxID=2529383 RepID=UPI0012BC0DB2
TLFVYNFTRYIQWPESNANITIGVLGDDPAIINAFKEMAEKKSSPTTKITVKQFSNPSEAADYQMVYIPKSNSAALKQIGTLKNTLVITEKEGLAKQGSYINFVTDNGKIRFEINKSGIDSSNLKVSGRLLGLAIVV